MNEIILSAPRELYSFGESPEGFNMLMTMESVAMESAIPDSERVLGPAIIKFRDSVTKAIGVIQTWEHDQSKTVRRYVNSMFDVNKARIKELNKSISILTKSVRRAKKLMNDKGITADARTSQAELFNELSFRLQNQIDESKGLHKNIFITPEHMKLINEAMIVAASLEGTIDGVYAAYVRTAEARTNPKDKRFRIGTEACSKELLAHTKALNEGVVSRNISELKERLKEIGDNLYGTKFEVNPTTLVQYPIENLLIVQRSLKKISGICKYFIDRLRDIREDLNVYANEPEGVSTKEFQVRTLEMSFLVSLFQTYSAYFTAYMTIQLSIPMAVRAIRDTISKNK